MIIWSLSITMRVVILIPILRNRELDNNRRTLSGGRIHRKASTHHTHSLGHSDQAKTTAPRVGLCRHARESAPVITDSQLHRLLLTLDYHLGLAGLRMFYDIVDRLLHDPVDADLVLLAEHTVQGLQFGGEGNARGARRLFVHGLNGFRESEAIELVGP